MKINLDKMIDRKGTGSMKWDLADRLYQGENLLPLWVADMDFLAPAEIIEAIKNRAEHGIFGYPVHTSDVDRAVQKWVKRHFHWEIEEKTILFTPGVVPTIAQIIQEFTEENDEIIIQPPVYPPFFQLVTNFNRTLLENPLRYENGKYTIDFEHLESIITPKTKMLLLCSPHNPVGRVWLKEELKKLAEICEKYNLLIVSDEIHADLTYEGHAHIPIASLTKEISERTITLLAPTKTFNMAAFQISYCIIENKSLYERIERRLRKQFLHMTNLFGELVTKVAYTHGDAWLNEVRKYVQKNYEFTKSFLEKRMPEISIVEPEGTYLLWLDFSKLPLTASERKKWLIHEAKVALNHGPTFGKEGEHFERMNIACSQETLKEGLERIERAYQKLLLKKGCHS